MLFATNPRFLIMPTVYNSKVLLPYDGSKTESWSRHSIGVKTLRITLNNVT